MDPLHPHHGGRVVLEREAVDDADAAVYRAALYTPEQLWRGQARVALSDGTVAFADWQPAEPPAWLVDDARAFLRAAWRDRPRWPQRIMRWRAP